MLPKNPDAKLPKVSVVIPAYNEEKTIARCLRSLLEQSYPTNAIEIILVDNNCSDHTVAIAQNFANITIITERKAGVGAARAAGWAIATGEVIASTDADCAVPVDWLETIVHEFQLHPEVVAVGGGYAFYDRGRLFNWLSHGVEHALINISYYLSGGVTALSANNLAIRHSSYQQTSGFDASLKFGEDLDLARKLHPLGKIRWLYKNRIRTSARRYSGWKATLDIIPYFLNFLSMSTLNKAFSNKLQNMRD